MKESEYIAMQERNRVRVEEMKKQMGKKYLLHPVNFVRKKDEFSLK